MSFKDIEDINKQLEKTPNKTRKNFEYGDELEVIQCHKIVMESQILGPKTFYTQQELERFGHKPCENRTIEWNKQELIAC